MEVYLDNAATTRPYADVIEAVEATMKNTYANPSALHRAGHKAEKSLKQFRSDIAGYLGLSENRLFFNSGGTEGNNAVIFSVFRKVRNRRKNVMLTSKIEHPSVLEAFKLIESYGTEVRYIDVRSDGTIDLDMLKNELPDAAFLSVMHVNNETGVIQPIEEIADLCNAENVAFHTDMVQSMGKVPVSASLFDKLDFAVFSAHKIHGPHGAGMTYVRNPEKMLPLIVGGGQENGLRSGTENLPGISGFAAAVRKAYTDLDEKNKKIKALKEKFISDIKNEIDDTVINGSKENSSAYIVNIGFPGTKGEVILHALENSGVYISTGSACSSKKDTDSHVLTAMGLDKSQTESALRVSFSEFTTAEEIEYAVDCIRDAVERFRRTGRYQ